jgi:hypothetical protein
VDVRVDEAGHDQLVAHFVHLCAGREPRDERRMRARRHDAAVFDDHEAVFVEYRRAGRLRGVAGEGQQLRAVSRLSHGYDVS